MRRLLFLTLLLKRTLALLALSACFGCTSAVTAEAPPLTVFGWLEQVKIYPSDILLHAKLDTGADNCSIHAEQIQEFTKDGESWVRFYISNRYGAKRRLQRQVVRTARIKKKLGGSQRRPVVRMSICLGDRLERVECNLVDRSNFQYPVLIGRNFLAGAALVNSSETYLSTPACDYPQKKK